MPELDLKYTGNHKAAVDEVIDFIESDALFTGTKPPPDIDCIAIDAVPEYGTYAGPDGVLPPEYVEGEEPVSGYGESRNGWEEWDAMHLFGEAVCDALSVEYLKKHLPMKVQGELLSWLNNDLAMVIEWRGFHGITPGKAVEDMCRIYLAGCFPCGWSGEYPDEDGNHPDGRFLVVVPGGKAPIWNPA